MTGPEHYRQSEAYGREAEAQLAEGNLDTARVYAELATGSATRALAAATALAAMSTRASTRTIRQWHDVAGSGRQMEDDL